MSGLLCEVSLGQEALRNTAPGQKQVSPCQGYERTTLRGRLKIKGSGEYRARSESGKSMPGVLAGGHVQDRFGTRGCREYRGRSESGKFMPGILEDGCARSV